MSIAFAEVELCMAIFEGINQFHMFRLKHCNLHVSLLFLILDNYLCFSLYRICQSFLQIESMSGEVADGLIAEARKLRDLTDLYEAWNLRDVSRTKVALDSASTKLAKY